MPRQRIRGYSRARRQQRIFYSSGKSSSKKRIRTYLERRKKKESNLPHSRALASGRFLRENLLRMKRKGISIHSSKNSLSLSLSLSLSALLFISLSLSLLCSLYRSPSWHLASSFFFCNTPGEQFSPLNKSTVSNSGKIEKKVGRAREYIGSVIRSL